MFLGEGFDTRILTLEDDEDPDSYVQEKGAEAFAEKVAEAPGVMLRYTRLMLAASPREAAAQWREVGGACRR